MPEYSTGPIDNPLTDASRTTAQLTVRLLNAHPSAAAGVLIEGYILGPTHTLYVSEYIALAPNQTSVRTYYANFDGLEYRFTVNEEAGDRVRIFAGGIGPDGGLNAVHRVLVRELRANG
ncbi:hypothetical protein F4V43_14640 [Paenibacillus spiritus]|uniref:Uncharacterized protein n=1 Tax=Paenibacillus spiritus TaxID=2496557 RepID=A0A5J5G155_9BACL|nr:hypothetical protein [Paenibacillus spiritus]KAA9000368.1 hypothetical protein F4V43_14640 [Paenibacillus spiritus]